MLQGLLIRSFQFVRKECRRSMTKNLRRKGGPGKSERKSEGKAPKETQSGVPSTFHIHVHAVSALEIEVLIRGKVPDAS